MSADVHLSVDLKLGAKAENVAVVRQALAGLAEDLGADGSLIGDVKIAVSEACENVIIHAYSGDPAVEAMEVAAEADEERLSVRVRDYGRGLRPRPAAAGDNLRLGLPLMSALADEFEIRGEAGQGTEVRMAFRLDRADRTDAPPPRAPAVGERETLVSVHCDGLGPSAIPRVATMVAARSGLDIDRVSDVEILGDVLADAMRRTGADGVMAVSVRELEPGIELQLGPLREGEGRRLLARGGLGELGNALERLSDEVEVEVAEGGGETLRLLIGPR